MSSNDNDQKKHRRRRKKKSSKSQTSSASASSSTDDQPVTKIDLCFVVDTTGSMSGAIRAVQTQLKQVATEICASDKRDLRLAAVEYKDHCDKNVTGVQPFDKSVEKVKKTIDTWRADGGGDAPEALADGLHEASSLEWREDATKLIVLCSDAPPHGIPQVAGDNHPNGCPEEYDPMDIANDLASRGIIVYTVGVNNPTAQTVAFLCAVAHITGGRYLPLANASSLPTVLIGGAEEESQLEEFNDEMARERDAVLTEAAGKGETLEDTEVFQRVTKRLQKRGVQIATPQNFAAHGGGAAWEANVGKLAAATTLSSYNAVASGWGATEYGAIPRCAASVPAAGGGGGYGGYGSIPSGDSDSYGALPMSYGAVPLSMPSAAPADACSYGALPISYEQVSRSMARAAKSKK